jgi:hypothetical protein
MVPLFVLILIAAVLCGIGITCEPQPPLFASGYCPLL